MKATNILLTIFLLSITSCHSQKRETDLEVDKEIIHINKVKRFDDVREIIPEEFMRDKKHIKLTTTNDDFLFKEISKIMMINNEIFILDGRLNKLLVFDMDGVSKAKIGAKGNGPNEYISITDFDIDSDGFIYTIDGRSNKMFIYNPDYSLNSVDPLPFEADILTITENNNIMFGLSAWNKGNNEGASIIITDKALHTIEVVAYYDEYIDNAYWVSAYSFVKTEEYIIYNKPINNNILLFTKSGDLSKIVELDFGSNDVPLKERKDIERNIQKFNSYNLLKWITIVDNSYLIGTFWEGRETKSFFIDRKKGEMYVTNTTIDRDISNVAGFDGKTLIKFITPESEKARDASLPEDIIDHLSNGDFVICTYELK